MVFCLCPCFNFSYKNPLSKRNFYRLSVQKKIYEIKIMIDCNTIYSTTLVVRGKISLFIYIQHRELQKNFSKNYNIYKKIFHKKNPGTNSL